MSSSSNVSVLPHLLSNSFLYLQFYKCADSALASAAFTFFTCTSFLLLFPLSMLVLYVGIQQWRKQRRMATAKAVSHSDFLTYNMIGIEPIGLLACGLYCCGIYTQHQKMMKAGVDTVLIVYLGRLLFQCLTCVEHYLAVIHPVTYLSLKTERGIKVRNISIGCVWLLCLGVLCFMASFSPVLPTIPFFTAFAFGMLLISFCSLSVLINLIRPGPGKVGKGDRKQVNQSKKRAFLTLSVITGVMLLKYVGLVVCTAIHASSLLDYQGGCLVLMSAFWFCLPSSLSLPLLFLYRAGKLPCCSHKFQSC